MLHALYGGLGAQVVAGCCSNREMGSILHHVPAGERIMLLGHGSANGLFYRKDDTGSEFDKILVGHPQAHMLRRHGGNLIGIWCHADLFAGAEGLHGLFSGMIISDMCEAEACGVTTDRESMDNTNRVMFAQLRTLLDGGTMLHEVPERMKALDTIKSDLSRFNYGHFHYM